MYVHARLLHTHVLRVAFVYACMYVDAHVYMLVRMCV